MNVLRPTDLRAQTWRGIDVFKLLMAFCVVAIHTNPLYGRAGGSVYTVYYAFVQCAVPFFFMASGFLFAAKCPDPLRLPDALPRLHKYLVRFVRMYVLWSAVYLLPSFADARQQGQSFGQWLIRYLRDFLLTGTHHNAWHLWYLLSMVYVLLLLCVLARLRTSRGTVGAICIVLFVFGLCLDTLHNADAAALSPALSVLRKALDHTLADGKLFRGALCFPLGMLLSRRSLSVPAAAALFAGGFAADCFAVGAADTFMCVVTAAGLFCLVLRLPLPESRAWPVVRQMSTWIYLIHMLVWTALYTICYGEKTYGAAMFFGTAAVSALLAFAVVWIAGRNTDRRKRNEKSTT